MQNTVWPAQAQHIAKIVDVPVVTQRQAPTIQTVHKLVEVPQTQRLDQVARAAAVSQYQVPTIQPAQKMVEVAQSHCFDRVVDVLQRNLRTLRLRAGVAEARLAKKSKGKGKSKGDPSTREREKCQLFGLAGHKQPDCWKFLASQNNLISQPGSNN